MNRDTRDSYTFKEYGFLTDVRYLTRKCQRYLTHDQEVPEELLEELKVAKERLRVWRKGKPV